MPTRREAITTLGAAALSLSCTRGQSSVSATPEAISTIGLQLYTVRTEMRNDMERTLERVAAIGYKEVEFAGYFERSARDIRRMLDDNNLGAPSSHIALRLMENDWEAVVDLAATIGHRYIVVAGIDRANRGSLDDYKRIIDRFNIVAERAHAAGITFGYHNYDLDFEPVDGEVPFDIMLRHADPQLVKFQMDLFWTTRGGGDPVTYFNEYPGRFPMVHVKDMASDGSMVDVGTGQIDFASIFQHSDTAGLEHYFIEHDDPADPYLSIRTGYDHLARIGL